MPRAPPPLPLEVVGLPLPVAAPRGHTPPAWPPRPLRGRKRESMRPFRYVEKGGVVECSGRKGRRLGGKGKVYVDGRWWRE